MEVREFIGLFIGGILGLALFATAVNKNSQTVAITKQFGDSFAQDIQAATFQS